MKKIKFLSSDVLPGLALLFALSVALVGAANGYIFLSGVSLVLSLTAMTLMRNEDIKNVSLLLQIIFFIVAIVVAVKRNVDNSFTFAVDMTLQSGDILSALIGSITALALLWSVYTYTQQRDLEIKREKEDQARKIAAWGQLKNSSTTRTYPEKVEYQINVANGSSAPIYSVLVYHPYGAGEVFTALPVVKPTKEPFILIVKTYFYENPNEKNIFAGEHIRRIIFRDSYGVYWEKDLQGILEERTDLTAMSAEKLREWYSKQEQLISEIELETYLDATKTGMSLEAQKNMLE